MSKAAEAPAAIGALVGTVDTGEGTVSFALQLQRTAFLVCLSAMLGLFISIIPCAILVWLLSDLLGVELAAARFVAKGLATVVSLGTAAMAAPIAWKTNAPASRTYLGREGIARFDRRREKADGPSLLMRFEEAQRLVRTLRVEPGANPTHPARVHFDYEWVGATGASLFRLHGLYEVDEASRRRTPEDSGNEHALAEQIEGAWNEFLLRRARAAVEAGELVEVVRDVRDRARRARIGRGFVELVDGARIERWEAQEISSLRLVGGAVTICRRNPLRGGDQEHRYPGGAMDNESFFPLALREIAGVVVEEAPRGGA